MLENLSLAQYCAITSTKQSLENPSLAQHCSITSMPLLMYCLPSKELMNWSYHMRCSRIEHSQMSYLEDSYENRPAATQLV